MLAPPEFLRLIAHDLRWQLLKALSKTDLRVQELVQQVGQPQNLVSYHLRQLLEKGLVRERRSLADSRSIYYSLDLDQVRAQYLASGQDLHPALGSPQTVPTASALPPNLRVLFLCTHNSARSQMAEALLRARSAGQIAAFSAGTHPAQVHPLAVRALAELNIDLTGSRSKSLEEYLGQTFDAVITVCDRAREACPVFPGDPVRVHWSFPDPAAVEGSEAERYQAFRETSLQLNTRISYLLLMLQRAGEAGRHSP